MKTILFLDITGVLFCRRCGDGSSCGHLDHLKRIVDALHCDIVLTSSFRRDHRATLALAEAFARHGIPEWIGITSDPCGERWTEIESWIREQGIQDHAAVVNQAANTLDAAMYGRIPYLHHEHDPTMSSASSAKRP